MLGNPYYPAANSGFMPSGMVMGSSYGVQQFYGGLPAGYASPQQSQAYGSIPVAPQTMILGASSYTSFTAPMAPVPQYVQAYYQPGRVVNECVHTHHRHYIPPRIMLAPAGSGMPPRFF